MSRYKRLDPPYWLEEELPKRNDRNLQPIDPVFNRDGLYWDRQKGHVWIEYAGRAWSYWHQKSALDFVKRELDLISAPWYTEREMEAFRTVWRYLPERARKPVQDHMLRMECRQLRREMEAHGLRDED